jgi:hypothetical protein
MACCSDGVITNRWANFKRSFCSRAMGLAISFLLSGCDSLTGRIRHPRLLERALHQIGGRQPVDL